ncbi:substrate-binding domain-containing protein [Actinospica robiniae]|uniref:substrate-binding domain-containing protein n=1 Tax=Actinospica robiniae TaxID=304901 RepID=UPI001B7FD699|nr:substrate-binding domain-containing protein [Actinospica robiniae]
MGLQPLIRLSLPSNGLAGEEVMRAFRVAEDVAVIGFDAGEHGALFQPSLTSVHIDAEAHGRAAARHILGLDLTRLAFGAGHLVLREST